MRLAHTAFAFLISTGCVLALTADARAGAPSVTRINSTVNAVNNAPGGPDGPCGNVGGLQNGTPGTTRTEAEWFNTCGNRLCISLGFQDGRVVEYTSTTDINAPVVLSCFTVAP
jgi:hypothetical protein